MRHPYHLVEPSPWPILISFNLLFLLISLLGYLNGYLYSLFNFQITLILLISLISLWLYDIIIESLYMGFHSFKVSKGLILGFIFFIITEIMLFFSLFWAYFHSALNPTDLIWPPIGIDLVNPWGIPLLNTLLLLYSGVAATVGHHSFLNRNKKAAFIYLSIGIILGIIFVFFQAFEYFYSSFDITDSVYSSTFYLITFFHGSHVIIGVTFLIVVLIRIKNYNSPNIFYDLALIYYHLVDAIWIALFILIYYMAY